MFIIGLYLLPKPPESWLTNPPIAADLAVDWISDKLYVVEPNAQRIQEYDLHTEQMRVVVNTGESSKPVSVAVYPYPGQG